MRKFLLLGLVFVLLFSALYADDAKVMPARVGRLYVAPTFGFGTGAYDEDGNLVKYDDGSTKLFNLGFALEYGITNWITGAVQWAPGVTVWSDIKPGVPASLAPQVKGDATINGVADLFVGAKIQVLGENAPVKTEMFRFALAPGVAIPLPGPNFEDELNKAMNGEKAALSKMDNHVLGVGGRFYFDWNINKNFFINLYNETLFYPIKQDLNKDGPNLAALKLLMLNEAYNFGGATAMAGAKALTDNLSGEVNYKYKLTFELEPQFSMPLSDGAFIFSAGLPVNYVYRPAFEYSFSGLTEVAGFAGAVFPGLTEDGIREMGDLVGKASHALSIKPNVSLFLTRTFLPLEFKLQYQLPIWGQSTKSLQHNMTMQIKAYFRI